MRFSISSMSDWELGWRGIVSLWDIVCVFVGVRFRGNKVRLRWCDGVDVVIRSEKKSLNPQNQTIISAVAPSLPAIDRFDHQAGFGRGTAGVLSSASIGACGSLAAGGSHRSASLSGSGRGRRPPCPAPPWKSAALQDAR
ncbi:transcriptional regulator, partial [Striga asiatica]